MSEVILKSPLPDEFFEDLLELKHADVKTFDVRVREHSQSAYRQISSVRIMGLSRDLGSCINRAEEYRKNYGQRVKSNPADRARYLRDLHADLNDLCLSVEISNGGFPPFIRPKTVISGAGLQTELHFDSVWGWCVWKAILRIKGEISCKHCGQPFTPKPRGQKGEYCDEHKTRNSRQIRKNLRETSANANKGTGPSCCLETKSHD